MRTIAISILILIVSCNNKKQEPNTHNISQVWSYSIDGDTVTFNFENESFKVDTNYYYEGDSFYFKPDSDSSYFRFNYASTGALFACCEDDDIYKEIDCTTEQDVVDRSGKVRKSNLYWREIKNGNVEIVYTDCPEEKLASYNRVMDAIREELLK